RLPPLHGSLVVQTLPSLHGAVLFVWTQPVEGLQESSVHGLESAHPSGGPPMQLPPLHLSFVVQALPSLQDTELAGWVQAPELLHLSSVQTFPSSEQSVPAGEKQLRALSLQWVLQSAPPAHGSPGWTLQVPPEQVSAPLQKT